MKNKIKTIKEDKIELTKITEFGFTYFENAQNVSQAMELGGYFCKIKKPDSSYIVEIYTSRPIINNLKS